MERLSNDTRDGRGDPGCQWAQGGMYYSYRSRCHGNACLNAAPKSSRHTASISCRQLNPIDALAGTSRGAYIYFVIWHNTVESSSFGNPLSGSNESSTYVCVAKLCETI